MDGKRPESRKKYVSGQSSGVKKRGSGLGTGPVGSGTSGSFQGNGSGSGGGKRVTRGGGISPLMIIIVLAVLLLGGGGGAMNLLGGSDADSQSLETVYQETVTANPGTTNNSSSSTSGSTSSSSSQTVDTTVAKGARQKYTEILGNGDDTVTIMVYLCGTDLESKYSMGTKDMVEMTKADLGDNVHILVYTGGAAKWNNKVVSARVNQIYEVVDGGLKCLESDMGSEVMTKPATLTKFINWCKSNYPANRNELILWDHGGGSVSGYGYDEKNARSGSMSLSGINQALKDADMKFDFIGFDACLMATVENGLMLSNYADYMIASEETEPGIGWYYTDWLTALGRNPSMSTLDIGKNIVDGFVSTCASQCRGQSATLSVVDLAELSATAPASLKKFSESLSTMISDQKYKTISTARNGSREFARSSAIDQIDLVDFANRVNNAEGKALASALQSAVKYNKTSSNMTGSYGVSIYFPYRKTSKVDTAVKTYDAIGMDESYSKAIQEFASLEVSGQVSSGGTSSPLPSLLGTLSGSSGGSSGYAFSSDEISSLLGSFLSSDFSSISGLSGSNTGFLSGRSLTTEQTADYIAANHFDPDSLIWSENQAGQQVLILSEDEWSLIEGLDLNMFYDDGEGYIDLGLDNVFDFDDDGNLIAATDRTWLAVNGQVVAYYHEATADGVTTGYIPVMRNGDRAELLVVFDDEHPRGTIVGARDVYVDGETDTVPKSVEALTEGDTLDFLCDYYSYDGEYQDSYYLGDQMTVKGELELSNVDVGEGAVRVTYRLTDLYQQHYWTPALRQ